MSLLRFGGKDPQGNAKGLNTDADGNLKSKVRGNTTEVAVGQAVAAGATYETDVIEKIGLGVKIEVRWLTGSGGFESTTAIEYVSESGVVLYEEDDLVGEKEIIDGNFIWRYRIDELKSNQFRLKVTNDSGSSATLGSITISSINDVVVGSNYKDLLTSTVSFSLGGEFTTKAFEVTHENLNVFVRSSGSGTTRNSPTIIVEFLSRNRMIVMDSIEYKTEYMPQSGDVIYKATIPNLKNKYIRLKLRNNEDGRRFYSFLMVNGIDSIFPDYEKSDIDKKLPSANLAPEVVVEKSVRVSDVDDQFVYGFEGTTIYRSNDALATKEAGFDLDTAEEGWDIQGVFKTHHGYVIVADRSGSGSIWFSEDFATGFTKQKLYEDNGDVFESSSVFGNLAMHFKNSSKLNDICMVGEYSTNGENVYLSLDGGQSWDLSLNVPRVDTGINHHVHVVLHDEKNGLLWAIYGDGTDNRAWKYSNDRGDTWNNFQPLNASQEFTKSLQPTTMIPTNYGYVVAPDFQQAPGFFGLRKRPISKSNLHDFDGYISSNFRSRPFYDLTKEEFIMIPSESSGQYYPRFPYVQRGNEIYALFGLQSGSPGKVTIFASGDGGESFHQIFHYHPSTATQSGLVGICKDGYIYFEARSNGDRETYRAKAIQWE